MTKLMTWTLHAPSSDVFSTYRDLAPGEPWYSKNYVLIDENAMSKWKDYRQKSFIEMIEKYPDKFYAIGLHQFGVKDNGTVYNMNWTNPMDSPVLSADKTQIERPVQKSLRYLMHNYPQIKWSLQFLCTSNSSGNRVDPVLDNKNGAQDTFINEVYTIMDLYLKAGFTNIKGVEIDFEKTTSRTNDHFKFRDLLVRVKNEVCIPLGLELRVNMFAMTGDLTPAYYAWHDYATLASGTDYNGHQAIDEFQLMSYDFSWGGSAPGPSTPLWWLEQVLQHVKDLEKRGLWKTEKVFIGNAGYGRRWPLGEDRMGVTMDYKQLMIAQNGAYIHNPGTSTTHNGQYAFWFNDQDFIPISGFNDEESDYQKTFLGVYDRFPLSSNGGAIFPDENTTDGNYINRPNQTYVTNYSRRQFPIFSGVVAVANNPSSTTGRIETNAGKSWNWPAERATGISNTTIFKGYQALDKFVPDDFKEGDKELEENEEGKITYTFSASGRQRLVAAVYWPFFDQGEIRFSLNGSSHLIDGNKYDWNPFMQAQETHFVDLGEFSFSGTNVIEVGFTNGARIHGFVVCSDFEYNLRGGEVTFPTFCKPMKKRADAPDENGEIKLINAQYPDLFRIVGEVLTRTPRPAIIWEDMFSSYVPDDGPETQNLTVFRYYPKTGDVKKGYTVGDWTATNGTKENDYAYAYNDSRQNSSQFMLNKRFAGNIAVELELRGNASDTKAVYGIRAQAVTRSPSDGYACLLDFGSKTVKIAYEDANSGFSTTIASKPMSASLMKMNGQRIKLRCYVVDGKISFWVEKTAYFDRVEMPYFRENGAYGFYNRQGRAKLYKLNISSLDRFERMERIDVIVDGKTYSYDAVERLPSTEYDEFGLIKYTGYPAEIADTVADLKDPDAGETAGSISTNTIADTQVNPKFAWSNDYKNRALAAVPSWEGAKNVTIRFKDAGIWFKSFYVGDNEGMSIAYNSDRIGFIRTANFVNEYGCKGIALWTLGQEDPTIYTYISG